MFSFDSRQRHLHIQNSRQNIVFAHILETIKDRDFLFGTVVELAKGYKYVQFWPQLVPPLYSKWPPKYCFPYISEAIKDRDF